MCQRALAPLWLTPPRGLQVVSYTLAYQVVITALQYCLWAAGRGRAEPVPGGFANVGEWKACAMQLVPALLLMDMYYYWCHRFLHLRLPYKCAWRSTSLQLPAA